MMHYNAKRQSRVLWLTKESQRFSCLLIRLSWSTIAGYKSEWWRITGTKRACELITRHAAVQANRSAVLSCTTASTRDIMEMILKLGIPLSRHFTDIVEQKKFSGFQLWFWISFFPFSQSKWIVVKISFLEKTEERVEEQIDSMEFK